MTHLPMIRPFILLACSSLALVASGQAPFTAGHYRTTDAAMGGFFYHHGIEAPGNEHLSVVDIMPYPPRLFRYASNGATLWQMEFAAPALQHCFRPVIMPDSSIALGGMNVDKCQLFHLGPDGSLLTAGQFPPGMGLYDLRPLGSDSLLMAGNIQHGPNDYKGLFVTTDPTGAIGNAWSIDLGVDRTLIFRLVRAMDNGYFALAGCRDLITPPGTPDTIGTGLVRLDDNGQPLWAVRFDNPEHCLYPDDVIELADGDLMIACRWRTRMTVIPSTF